MTLTEICLTDLVYLAKNERMRRMYFDALARIAMRKGLNTLS